jgi:hypothetical protein
VYRIYFDENAGDQQDRFDLGIPGALRDIAPVAASLCEGLRVLLYDDQEIEVEASLVRDDASARWMAIPDWATMRRHDTTAAAAAH